MVRTFQRVLILLFSIFFLSGQIHAQSTYAEEGKNRRNVTYFDVQGIRLKMKLDHVRQNYNFANIKKVKDELGVVSEYEIKNRSAGKSMTLRFTGEKRLYRITFINTYLDFKKNAEGVYTSLLKKYGDPYFKRKTPKDSRDGNIFSCWGEDCKSPSYTPYAPKLTAHIQHLTGKVRLVLADHSIHRADWKKYKAKRDAVRHKKRKFQKPKPLKKIEF